MPINDLLDTLTLPSLEGDRDDAARVISPAIALAKHILDAALTRRQRRALKSRAKVIIIETFDDESVEMIQTYLRAMENAPKIVTITDPKRYGRDQSGGADYLSVLEDGRSILFIVRDAATQLASEVHAAADHHIVLPRPGLKTIRRTIRAVTGTVARGLLEGDLSGLSSLDVITAIRPNTSAAQCVANLRRASQWRRAPQTLGAVRALSDLALTRAVRTWSDRTLQIMATVSDGSAPTSSLRFGLMQGPPGTGKTTIAAGLARSAGWQFLSDSVAGWFATSDGHLGSVVKASSRFFESLKSAPGPIVGFLDELDALPNRAALDARDSQWWSPVITHVLLQIDLLRKAGKPILLIGATNHPEKLDGALVRAGRLETGVPVFPPDLGERADLFQTMLKGEIERADAEILARLSPGATPAMIESHVESARNAAKGRKEPLVLADLVAVVAPPSPLSAEKQHALAIHEAGHAIVALELGVRIEEVSLLSRGMIGGSVTTSPGERLMTRKDIDTFVTIGLGGRAADMVLGSGPNAGAVADLQAANGMLEKAVTSYGLYGSLRSESGEVMRTKELETLISRELDARLSDALAIVERRRGDVQRLAHVLVEERVVSGARVVRLIGPAATCVELSEVTSHPDEPELDAKGNGHG